MRQELQHLGRNIPLQLLAEQVALGGQDAKPQLVGRGMDIRHQAIAEARAHPLLHPLKTVR